MSTSFSRNPEPLLNAENSETTNKKVLIPPIVVRQPDDWTNVSRLIRRNRSNFAKEKPSSEDINIHPQTVDDYHLLIKCLDQNNVKYHTFQLKSEKLLKIVNR